DGSVTSTINLPGPQVSVTWIQLDRDFNDSSRREPGSPDWTSDDGAYVKVHFAFGTGAIPTTEMSLTLSPGDPMVLKAPVETPQDGKAHGAYLLEDHDTVGAEISASLDFATRILTPSPLLGQTLA